MDTNRTTGWRRWGCNAQGNESFGKWRLTMERDVVLNLVISISLRSRSTVGETEDNLWQKKHLSGLFFLPESKITYRELREK